MKTRTLRGGKSFIIGSFGVIYLFGNCQLEFTAREMDLPYLFRPCSTPAAMLSTQGTIPHDLADWNRHFRLEEYMHGRDIVNQFQLIAPDDIPPELMVFNMFHENEPLFAHIDKEYVFFVDPAAWKAFPLFKEWMEHQFRIVKLPEMDYMNRWARMIHTMRLRYPETPILILTRLSHYPAFGPDPYSYLKCWDKAWEPARPFIRELASELGNCHVLEMDRLFAGLWRENPVMDQHCPFLKIRTENGKVEISRDLEHVGSMWPVVAERIGNFARRGVLEYRDIEFIPDEWVGPWMPGVMDNGELSALLATGGNYDAARAVGMFFRDLSTDYTALLCEHGSSMPVCHSTLHMIQKYAEIWPTQNISDWCDKHRRTARNFMSNGQEYNEKYLARLSDIKSLVCQEVS